MNSSYTYWIGTEKDVVSHAFEILVRGIDGQSLAGDIETAIRDSLQQMAWAAACRVVVRPSCESGRWEFGFHKVDVRYVLSIAVPPELLPDLMLRRRREWLNHAPVV